MATEIADYRRCCYGQGNCKWLARAASFLKLLAAHSPSCSRTQFCRVCVTIRSSRRVGAIKAFIVANAAAIPTKTVALAVERKASRYAHRLLHDSPSIGDKPL
jgi:hypothetical protein